MRIVITAKFGHRRKRMSNASLKRLRSTFAAQLLIAAVMAVGPAAANAHAVLIESSLRDRVISPQTPAIAVARFNVNIETEFTKVVLVNARGEKRSLDRVPGSPRGEVRVKLPPLAPGMYEMRYKVLAADG
ncbi:MAG: copper resistance protein CopC, partial [Betaproteobacteria bacterium]|nr:copper resistance protein CopC [Betaproteobacteria bacterium]